MKSSTWTMALAVGLGVVVILVGLLQRRWIDEIEGHEHYFQMRQISYSSWLFKIAFDWEITRLARSFEGAAQPGETLAGVLQERRQQWRDDARWPSLLRNVYRLDRGVGGARLAVLDDAGHFTPVTPGPRLARLLEDPAAATGTAEAVPQTTILASVPAIVVPPARRDAGPAVVLELDLDTLQNRLLPDLVLWMYPSITFEDVELAVVETESGRLIYSTLPIDRAEDLGRVDAEYGLAPLGVEALPPSFFGENQSTPSTEWRPSEKDRAWFRGLWSHVFYAGHWKVLVRWGEVPIDQKVAAGSTRETLLAGLALTLLAASVVVLVRATRGAQRFARERLDLIARVSHELRTPLAVLAAAGENLNDGVDAPHQRRQYGRLIRREAQRLQDTVENVLHLARRDSGAPVLQHHPLDLAALTEEVLRTALAAVETDEISVEADLEPVPLIVGEAAAVRSAILNLVSNALKYGRQAGWLGVQLTHQGDAVRLAVSDQGPGIDPAERQRVFEPYFRGQRARTEQIEGSGLGLAVVRDIMAAHGGEVTLQAPPEGGTTVTLAFPVGEPV